MLIRRDVVFEGRMTGVVEKGISRVGGGYTSGIADANIGKLGVMFNVRGIVDHVGRGG